MFRRIFYIFLLTVVTCVETQAQQDPSFSHYWAMETSFNPAAVGKQQKINVNVAYNMSLVGFKRNPRTMFISGDLPFYAIGTNHGVGAQIVNDEIGLFSHKRLSLQYAYKQRLLGGVLSVGVQGGMLSETLDGSDLDLEQSGDNAFSTSSVNGSGFDIGAGLYYQHKSWYVGASALHVNAPTVELGETNEISLAASYYLTAGCNIRLRNPFLTIHPSVLGRSDGVGYRADISTRLKYTHDNKMMYAGLGYSPTNSVTLFLGGNFHGVTLGYSYEMYTGTISIGNGSHELYVNYQTDLNLFKKGRNKHQSVRIL